MRSWSYFRTEVPAKWVLAGEHAVLRGASAVALPHPALRLKLSFDPALPDADSGFQVEPSSSHQGIADLLQAIRENTESDGQSFRPPEGTLRIASSIPAGAGLGSSAALCVALSRWVAEPLGIPDSEVLEFAHRLEHRFHGRSSGMDIAVVSRTEPISFSLSTGAQALGVRRLPTFTFHDTGLRARTLECVSRVDRLREEDPWKALQIDEAMGLASRECAEGLFRYDQGDDAAAIDRIAVGMNRAQECFYQWGLVPGDAKRHLEQLLERGARAVKLTGAGGGGFLVALWNSQGT